MPNENPIEVLCTISFPEELVQKWRELSPRLHITVITTRRVEDISNEIWARTEVLYTDRVLPPKDVAPNLHWVQFHFAGIDFAVANPLIKEQGLIMTTLSGAAAPQVAEFAVGAMLAIGHKFPIIQKNQQKTEWPTDRWQRFVPRELRGSTVGIIGYGSIGREIARLLQPFSCTILAAKRDVFHPKDYGYQHEGYGDPEGNLFKRLYPIQALKSMLKLCDFAVVCLPLTQETRGLIGEEELKAMKKGAYLIDVGRGGVVDGKAVEEAVKNDWLGGAVLDVFTEEPLPGNNPLWQLPNSIISPHVAGISSVYLERAAELFGVNLQRYIDEEPLLNRFDPERGY